MSTVISNALSRKAMKEVKFLFEHMSHRKGHGLLLKKAMKYACSICEKYMLTCYLDKETHAIVIRQNNTVVGMMPVSMKGYGWVKSLGILVGDAV